MEWTREMFEDISEDQDIVDKGSNQLYFFKLGKYTKIGISYNSRKRLNFIKGHNPYPVKAKKVINYESQREAFKTESQLHGLLFEYNIRGEWFGLPYKHRKGIRQAIPFPLEDKFFSRKIIPERDNYKRGLSPKFKRVDIDDIGVLPEEEKILERALDKLPQ